MKRKFPNSRLRRLRLNSSIIDLVSENTLNSADLIQPVFVKENLNGSEPIESMPNVNRYGIDSILKEVESVISSGIKTIAIFPVIDSNKKDDLGKEALNEENIISKTIKLIKKEFPELVIIADVALDPYTSHGHDGLLINNYVDNDATLESLVSQSLILAASGADIIAP